MKTITMTQDQYKRQLVWTKKKAIFKMQKKIDRLFREALK